MPLEIAVTNSPAPPAQLVGLQDLQRLAASSGNPNASRADMVGITVPRIRVDQTGLRYEQRRGSNGIEFRFESGRLQLTISNQVYLLNTLGPCEQSLWEEHERLHVQDNESLGPALERGIRNHASIKAVFELREWRPRANFNVTQQSTQQAVGDVFSQLTTLAVSQRDTAAEYARVRREIQRQCSGSGRTHVGGQATGRPTVAHGQRERP